MQLMTIGLQLYNSRIYVIIDVIMVRDNIPRLLCDLITN